MFLLISLAVSLPFGNSDMIFGAAFIQWLGSIMIGGIRSFGVCLDSEREVWDSLPSQLSLDSTVDDFVLKDVSLAEEDSDFVAGR